MAVLMFEILRSYLKMVFLLVLVWILFYLWNTFSCRRVVLNEMNPTIPHDTFKLLLLNKRTIDQLAYDDILAFEYEYPVRLQGNPEGKLLARLVGKPGDRVRITQGGIYLNDKKINESYLSPSFKSSEDREEIIVPRDTLYVVCDNRSEFATCDSRGIGPLGIRAVAGTVKQ